MGALMTKRPLDNIAYSDIAAARQGARSRAVNIPCPLCGPTHKGASAMRKTMRDLVARQLRHQRQLRPLRRRGLGRAW